MADEVPWRPTLRRKSPFGKPFRPFSPFARIREQQPNHLEVERFEVFGPTRVEDAWLRRRRHAPLDLHVPAAWNLDAIYLRHAEERSYCERLHQLQVLPSLDTVSVRLVCFDRPWVPYRWPEPPRVPELSSKTYPMAGDVPDPDGGVALDSPWQLREASVRHGTGDPGRLLMEGRTEHRMATNTGFLVPFQQVEFLDQLQGVRDAFYVPCPPWWEEAWISRNMSVPLPPIVTYKASQLLHRMSNTPEGRFWWLVFESEWTVLVFARWCSDVRQRKLMWRLPARLRENLTTMGVDQLVLDSDFPLPVVQQWLTAHDTYDWSSQRRRYRMAGPSRDNPNGVYQDLVEFARIFDPMGEALVAVEQPEPSSNQPEGPRTPGVTTETEHDPLLKTPPGARKSVSPDEKILASGSVPLQLSPSHQSQTIEIPAFRSVPYATPPIASLPRQGIPRGASNVTKAPSVARAGSATATKPQPSLPMSEPARRDPASHPASYYDVYERGLAPLAVPVSDSLRVSLLQAGLGGVMQHYARVRQADDGSQVTGELPILEETVVETIYQLDAAWRRTDARCERSEAAEEHMSRDIAELRAELKKAEIMRDLLLERVSRLEEEARGTSAHYGPDAKRPRY